MSDREPIDSEAEKSLREERVRYMLLQSWTSIFLSPMCSVFMAVALWGRVDSWKLLLFVTGLVGWASARYALQRQFPRDEAVDDPAIRRWEKWMVLSILMPSLWWGFGGLTMVAGAPLLTQVLIFTSLNLVGCGGSLRYAIHPASAIIVPAAIGLPVSVYMLLSQERTTITFGLSGLLLVAVTLQTIERVRRLFIKAHTLSYKLDRERKEVLQVNLELEESYRELERVESMRSTLTEMIVHDLRSPLSGTNFCLESIRDSMDATDEDSWDSLERLESLLRQMTDMIENILDVSRLEQDSLKLYIDEHNFSDLVQRALDKLGPVAASVRVRESREVSVRCDGDLLSRVLLNLVSNALRFSPPGRPVDIVTQDSQGSLLVSVVDEGIGVPEALREKIFEKFVHGAYHEGRQRSKGLGLAFCKLVVESHQGRIGVVSNPGEPTRFWFELPL